MKNITILAIGKLKEPYSKDAIVEYAKRLRPFVNITIIELPSFPFKKEGEKTLSIKKENDSIYQALERFDSCFIVSLDKKGKRLSSEVFASFLEKENRDIVFIIGGALGLNDVIRKKSHMVLSFSDMTFTHEMSRVILIEQIYRAVMINNNRDYHY
jgi:23S rRNA (pseudouridine1915-N3)-methyltransferase